MGHRRRPGFNLPTTGPPAARRPATSAASSHRRRYPCSSRLSGSGLVGSKRVLGQAIAPNAQRDGHILRHAEHWDRVLMVIEGVAGAANQWLEDFARASGNDQSLDYLVSVVSDRIVDALPQFLDPTLRPGLHASVRGNWRGFLAVVSREAVSYTHLTLPTILLV